MKSFKQELKTTKQSEEHCLSESQQIPPKITFCEQFQNRFVEGTRPIVKKESILDDCLATQKLTILSHFDTTKCWNLHCNFRASIFEILFSAKDNGCFQLFLSEQNLKFKIKFVKMKFKNVFKKF